MQESGAPCVPLAPESKASAGSHHPPLSWTNPAWPLEIDVGCHRGAFIVEMAQRFANVRFLGIERQRSRVERCRAKIDRLSLCNAQVIHGEGLGGFDVRIEDRSVARIHVSFPDPWPKRRHHVRRMVSVDFLLHAHRLLIPGGELRLMTDDLPYFTAMKEAVVETKEHWAMIPWDDGRELAMTEFQRKFAAKGLVPFRLALRVSG